MSLTEQQNFLFIKYQLLHFIGKESKTLSNKLISIFITKISLLAFTSTSREYKDAVPNIISTSQNPSEKEYDSPTEKRAAFT